MEFNIVYTTKRSYVQLFLSAFVFIGIVLSCFVAKASYSEGSYRAKNINKPDSEPLGSPKELKSPFSGSYRSPQSSASTLSSGGSSSGSGSQANTGSMAYTIEEHQFLAQFIQHLQVPSVGSRIAQIDTKLRNNPRLEIADYEYLLAVASKINNPSISNEIRKIADKHR